MDNRTSDWVKGVLQATASIREVINSLNSTGLQIVLVVSPGGELVGTVTDGDIRRGFLAGGELEGPVGDLIHRDPVVVGPEIDAHSAEQIMRKEQVQHLPIVDRNRRLVGLHRLRGFAAASQHSNLVVVMAGGEGLRLRPYTESCPKPMLPLDGRPILEHILEGVISQGFSRIVFAVHYLSQMIVDHFGDGSAWDVEISYLHEKELLGTAGGLALLEALPDSPIVVVNGDVLSNVSYVDMIKFHESNEAWGSMAIRLHEWQLPFGVVTTQGVDIIELEEKPSQFSYVNAGVYVLDPGAVRLLPGGPQDMPNLFELIQKAGKRTIVFPFHEPWVDVGHMEEYLRASGRLDEGIRIRPQIDVAHLSEES